MWNMDIVCGINTITKLPESGDLCSNITEFEVVEGDPPPPQMK